jgi:hypothetical protein
MNAEAMHGIEDRITRIRSSPTIDGSAIVGDGGIESRGEDRLTVTIYSEAGQRASCS